MFVWSYLDNPAPAVNNFTHCIGFIPMYCSCQGCGLLDGVLTPVAEHFSGSAKIKIPAAVYYSIVNAGHLDHRRQRLKRLSTHTGPYCRSLPLYLRLLALSPTLSVAFKFCATAIRASSSISVLPIPSHISLDVFQSTVTYSYLITHSARLISFTAIPRRERTSAII